MSGEPNQRHILVINDIPYILDLFRDLLGDAGYRVTTDRFIVEMDQMLDQVKQLKPDLVILDYMFGREGEGWQFLQMLRMARETRHIPAIVCTGAIQQIRELQNHLDEMDVAVVIKPFDIDHLLEVVNKVWERAGTA